MKRNLCETFFKISALSLIAVAPALGCGVEPMDPESEARQTAEEEVGVVESAITYDGHDYLFVITPKTWEEAQSHCQLAGGYSLVTINDANEEAFLHTQETKRGLSNWWIGANDRGIEGSWVWANGSSVYTNWAPGEPNNHGGNEDCVMDNWYGNGQWNDGTCNSTFPFICERDPAPTGNRGSFSYTASNTASATVNTYNYSIQLYAGQLLTVGTCGVPGSSGSGDTYLRINNPYGQEIASNNDSGGTCSLLSNISIVVPVTGAYTVRAGCYNSGSCSGTVAFNY